MNWGPPSWPHFNLFTPLKTLSPTRVTSDQGVNIWIWGEGAIQSLAIIMKRKKFVRGRENAGEWLDIDGDCEGRLDWHDAICTDWEGAGVWALWIHQREQFIQRPWGRKIQDAGGSVGWPAWPEERMELWPLTEQEHSTFVGRMGDWKKLSFYSERIEEPKEDLSRGRVWSNSLTHSLICYFENRLQARIIQHQHHWHFEPDDSLW